MAVRRFVGDPLARFALRRKKPSKKLGNLAIGAEEEIPQSEY